MYFGEIAAFTIAFTIAIGVYLLLPQGEATLSERLVRRFAGLSKIIKSKPIKVQDNNLFAGTSKFLDRGVYSFVRHAAFIFLLSIGVILFESWIILFAIVLYLATYPQEQIFNVPLPMGIVKSAIMKSDKYKKDVELVECLSLLKNLIVQQKENPVGAEYIVEYLAASASITKPAFLMLLRRLRLGRFKEAEDAFYEEIGTELAKELGHLLVQMDSLNPVELEEAIISRQVYVKEFRKTKETKQAEFASDLVYIPIVINVMFILFNFLIVAYYLPQREAIQMIF